MRISKTRDWFWAAMGKAAATLALAAALALSGAAVAFAAPAEDGNAPEASTSTASSTAAQDAESATADAAVQKSEMVYGMLRSDGSVRETYVVNRFVSDKPCSAVDYGRYLLVANLSTTQKLTCDDGKVAFDKEAGPFFYQGTLGVSQLPWIVSLSYTLDGQAVEPDALAGSSGLLGIKVNTRANPQVDSAFYKSFVLQLTFTLDGDTCSDIKAKDATLAASGKDQTIAFTVLPGHDGSFELSAQVTDFEMPAAQIAALPYSSVVEMPDTDELESGLNDLADAVSQINDGTSQLASGVEELSSGAGELASGADAFGNGLSKLASSSDQIVNASAQIDESLGKIADALDGVDLSGLDDLSKYAPLLRQTADALEALRAAMQDLKGEYARMAQALDTIAGIVNANALSEEEIEALRAAVADDEEAAATMERLLSSYAQIQAAIDEYYAGGGTPEDIEAQIEALFADGGELDQGVQQLRAVADFLENGGTGQIEQLFTGLTKLANGYSQFHAGLVNYTKGVQQLDANYNELSSGMAELADGTNRLTSGAVALSGGVAELERATRDLPAQMRERMDEMMADYDFPEFKPVSFVDKRNKNVTAVQFVMLVDAIEKPKPVAPEPEPEPEPTIWDRFLDLFGLR